MKYTLVAVALLVTITSASAQQSWKKSWCITQKGDTLHGQILFMDWEISPSQIVFRDTLNRNERIFGTTDLKSFGLRYNKREEIFESKTVTATHYSGSPVPEGSSPLSVDTLSRFIELKFHSDIISLFELSDDDKLRHYYILKNAELTELQYGKATMIKNNKPYAYKNNRYRNQLKSLLEECPTLDVSSVDYNDKSLIKLLTEYHSFCKVNYAVFVKNGNKMKINIGIGGSGYFYPKEGSQFYPIDGAVRLLLPKKFYNRFLSLEGGMSGFFLNAGSYFGKDTNKLLPLAYVTFQGPIPEGIGIGVSWRKKLDFSAVALKSSIVGLRLRFYPTLRGKASN